MLNNGTVIVDRPTTFNKSGGQYTNNATFDVNSTLTIDSAGTFEQAAGTFDLASAITVTGGSAFNLTGGTLAMDGNINLTGGTVFTQSAGTLAYTSGTISTGTFDYEGGTITGTPQLSIATLQIGPAATNAASFLFTNNGNLEGDLHAGQTVTLQDSFTTARMLTSATGFTNDGSILLTGTSSGSADLVITSGTLTNSATGLVHFQTGGTGLRTFTGDLLNNGTVIVDRPTTFNKSGGQYTNNATFNVNSTLTITDGTLTNFAANTLTDGTYDVASTFRFPAPTSSPTTPRSSSAAHRRTF